MLKKLYKNIILKFPISTIMTLLLIVGVLGYFSTKLEIDASSQTLMLENDSDLQFSREVNTKFYTTDFLVVTFKPKSDLLDDSSLETIKKFSHEVSNLPLVSNVTSILNVPLLQSPVRGIKELVDDVRTLENYDANKTLVREEFLNSPLYKGSLVSKDFKTTAILINLKRDEKYFKLLNERNELLFKKGLSQKEQIDLANKESEFKNHRDKQREIEHKNIEDIRKIISKYRASEELFLGGVSMIADDVITFVKSDLVIYGSTLVFLLIFILWLIFRQLRWIVLPIFICIVSVISTTGILGFFAWEITVISSNFIALQLIITISIVLHLIVRYRELALKYSNSNQYKLVMNTMLSKANPSLFAIITTIAGFGSLILSSIKPVINLGWMMSSGIAMSLFIAFILFPAIMIKLPRLKPYTKFENSMSLTTICSNIVTNNKLAITIGTVVVIIFSILGASNLIVENSFINYFKKSTEIYKGMEVIDKSLGGTTPLDIVVKFNTIKEAKPKKSEKIDNDFDSFEAEFEASKDEEQYWFTKEKMNMILKIHDYLNSIDEIGNVQSFATMLKIGKILNNNIEVDSFKLALLYTKLPEQYRNIILAPYINIKENEVRFSTRIIDSNPTLRRDALIQKIYSDLEKIIPNNKASFRLSNLMVLYNNMLQSLFDSQIKTLGFVVAILFIMFLILFRSFLIAFIAIITNLIPIGIVFGIMGIFEIPLDIMTITIAAISIGIGVDDTIHYIHRYKEEYKKDHNYIEAMRRSHHSIGYAMYYTSLVVVVGFSILVLSNLIPTIYFGLLTVIVMITILVSALLLLPRLLIVLKPYGNNKKL